MKNKKLIKGLTVLGASIFMMMSAPMISYASGITEGIQTLDDDFLGNGDGISSENVWDGNKDTSWYHGTKTEFVLTTPQQLAGLAQLVNEGNTFEGKKIILGNDMFFNESDSLTNVWTPIASCSSNVYFEGTFDGQGHTLYNLNTYDAEKADGGLFGIIGEKGIVKAVRISQGKLCGSAIADENYGWILFCENDSSIENIYDLEYIGGICGINYDLVYGCGNKGNINGAYASVAGVVGGNLAESATIDSCWNQGRINGRGFEAAGIVGSNWGWIYDCYNAGSISGTARVKAGIIGQFAAGKIKMYNCYNSEYLNLANENMYCSNTICGEGYQYCKNMYSIASGNSTTTKVTLDELKSASMIPRIQGETIITKWCTDELNLNNGCIIPIAQKDMEKGIYKILPDVWNAKTEVTVKIEDGTYQLKPFSYAYYGMKNAEPVYSSDSDIFSITSEGLITPHRVGTAIVKVTFPETEHTKEASYEVKVVVSQNSEDNSSTDETKPEPEPSPMPDSEWPFGDVAINPGNWKYESVKYVYENGIMTGTGNNEFQPDAPLTRSMFATMLYRMSGEPTVTFINKYSDVPAGQWYSNAVIWASEQGIVNGYGNGDFGTNDYITREQIAKMLMEYGKVKGYDVRQSADFSAFADASDVSGWANDYMRWAVGSGMIGGKSIDGKLCLAPKGNATRAESATMLKRFMEKYQ